MRKVCTYRDLSKLSWWICSILNETIRIRSKGHCLIRSTNEIACCSWVAVICFETGRSIEYIDHFWLQVIYHSCSISASHSIAFGCFSWISRCTFILAWNCFYNRNTIISWILRIYGFLAIQIRRAWAFQNRILRCVIYLAQLVLENVSAL